MPTRGPVLRQAKRTILAEGDPGRGLLYPVGTRTVNVSTLVLRRPTYPRLRPAWAPDDTISLREVVADGHIIGHIAAHEAAPNNPTRPTRFRFRSADGSLVLVDSYLDGLRTQIDRAYPEGAELPTRED